MCVSCEITYNNCRFISNHKNKSTKRIWQTSTVGRRPYFLSTYIIIHIDDCREHKDIKREKPISLTI